MKKILILVLTISTLFSCAEKSNSNENTNNSGTPEITKIYPLKEYQEDFNEMVELLLKKHPQPYAFISEDSLNKLINNQYDRITDSTRMGRFIWICQEVVAAINCGHSEVWSYEFNKVPKSMVFPSVLIMPS